MTPTTAHRGARFTRHEWALLNRHNLEVGLIFGLIILIANASRDAVAHWMGLDGRSRGLDWVVPVLVTPVVWGLGYLRYRRLPAEVREKARTIRSQNAAAWWGPLVFAVVAIGALAIGERTVGLPSRAVGWGCIVVLGVAMVWTQVVGRRWRPAAGSRAP